MKWHRIWGIILRYNYLFKRSLDRQADMFYWPTMDLLLWGITGSYFMSHAKDIPYALTMIVSGLVLWIILWRGQGELTINILEDMWNKNLINIFSSPLKLSEWIAAFLILGLTKAAISVSFGALVAFILYKVQLFAFGFKLLPFLFLLLLTGWWVGMLVGGLIMRYGGKVQQFAWSMVFLIAPFSAIYYPLTALPRWAQTVARGIPSSYVFEGARQVILTGQIDWHKIFISLGLNIIFLALGFWFFRSSFKKVLNKGLVKLF